MHSANSVIIQASRERIFDTVSDLGRWPEQLPHYRYVKFLGQDGGRDIVAMSARRGWLPVSWVSAYVANRETLEMHFEHLRKWTKGMAVTWTLTPTGDGTKVEIVHTMKFRVPWLAWFAEPIIGGFIMAIANKTLAVFKQQIEAGEGAA